MTFLELVRESEECDDESLDGILTDSGDPITAGRTCMVGAVLGLGMWALLFGLGWLLSWVIRR